jgi:elongation factor Tu
MKGRAGDNIGVLLRGIGKDEVERGMVLAKPGSITPHTKFKAEVYILDEGRRGEAHTVFQWIQAAVLFQDDGCDRSMKLPEGVEMVMPGDNVTLTGRVDSAYSHGEGAEVCHKGRWKDSRCWGSN